MKGTIETLRAIKKHCDNSKCYDCCFQFICNISPCSWDEEDIQLIAAFKGKEDKDHENR